MRISKVSLYVREHSSRKYTKVKNSRSNYVYPAGTTYVLRYGSTWETLDSTSLTDARIQVLRRQLELQQGWAPEPTPKPKSAVLLLDRAIDTYLAEIKDGRKKKTHQAYSVALRYFYECVGNKPMSDIDRGDMLKFTTFLREEKQQAARSCWNKFSNVVSFLKHHDVKPRIKAHDWPQYTEEEPEIYEQETLDKFFAECDEDERLLFEFFQMTGMREQEVIYATDRNLDLSANTVTTASAFGKAVPSQPTVPISIAAPLRMRAEPPCAT